MPTGHQRPAEAERALSWGSLRCGPWALGLIAGSAALALYTLTCSRGIEWQDSGVHQYRILTGALEHPWGLALSHPLHYWLGRAVLRIPLGDAVFRLNLMSSFCGAVGVGVLAGVVLRLSRSRPAALLAAATLALAHSYWQMSALTETYTLAAALMIIEWTCLLRYARTQRALWLILVFAANGLHVADHLLGLLTLGTYVVLFVERLVRRRVSPGWLPVAIVVWLVAASPYLTLVAQHLQRTGDLGETIRSALFGGGLGAEGWGRDVLNVTISAGQLKLAAMTLGYCFPSAAILVAVAGLLRPLSGRRGLFRRVLLVQTVIIVVFVARYTIKDLYTFFVPVCVLVALWLGVGTAGLLRRCRTRAARRAFVALMVLNALLPIAVYWCFPAVARQRGWLRERLRDIPYRDEYTHFFRPWRFLDDSPERFARDALARAGPGGWIVADSTTAFPITVAQLTRGGPPEARVYWLRDCLTAPLRPALTDGELREHVRHGGQVIGVPAPEVKAMIREPLAVEPDDPFWRIRLPASGMHNQQVAEEQ